MVLTLIGVKDIYKIVLPEVAIGNYWISDSRNGIKKELVNIEAQNGKWQISTNNFQKIINPVALDITNDNIKISQNNKIIIDRVELEINHTYYICLGDLNDLYILYCSSVYESNLYHLDVNNTNEIYIGRGKDSHISYNHDLVATTHAKLSFYQSRWIVENIDKKFGTIVNNKKVLNNTQVLFNGDVIFIMGLKIIIMGKSIYINNPLNKMECNSNVFSISKIKNAQIKEESYFDDNEEIEIYSEKDYFSRAPRLTNKIEREEVRIDPPPTMKSNEETPLILVLGTSLTMGVMSIITLSRVIDGAMSGTASTKETIYQSIMAIAMLISMIVFPLINRKYEKIRKKRYEQKRQEKYGEYVENKVNVINNIRNKQRKILYDNYVSTEECINIILNRGRRLWERKIEEFDFLTFRLGIGDTPLEIDIKYPEEKFTMDDDNLIETVQSVSNESKILKDVPITFSLVEKNISALITKDNDIIDKFVKNMLLQLITFHSYQDLKLVFLLKEDKKQKWEYIKLLPHIWNQNKEIRFFADNYNDAEQISKFLVEEFKSRNEYVDRANYTDFNPYYLIITDDYKSIEDLRIIKNVLNLRKNIGFSLFCIADNLIQLPNECETFIDIEGRTGQVFESATSSTIQTQFLFNPSEQIYFDKICRAISNIPIKYIVSSKESLPSTYSFLEMYNVRTN